MKPVSIKEIRQKEVRSILKERRSLSKKLYELGYKKIEKPIRHGWYIELVLMPQLERYKCKPEIEEIIVKLTCSYWGRTKEEAQRRWNKAESQYLIYRGIPTLSHKSYSKLSDKAKKYCTRFTIREYGVIRIRYYVRIPKHAYKIKFKRAYTTHSKIIDPLMIERMNLIDQQLLKKGWYSISQSTRNYRCRWKTKRIIIDRKKTKIALGKYKQLPINELKNESQWANRN